MTVKMMLISKARRVVCKRREVHVEARRSLAPRVRMDDDQVHTSPNAHFYHSRTLSFNHQIANKWDISKAASDW